MRTWPEDWEDRRRGVDCPVCQEGRPDEVPSGVRVFAGQWSDAYLNRDSAARGYSLVFWRGRHVADLTELTEPELFGFAAELRRVSRGIEHAFQPAKLNVLLLGNSIPHLHAHVVPRYLDDPDPGRPPRFMMEDRESPQIDEAEYVRQLDQLRSAIADLSRG